jgi:hypothetical protein
MNLWWPLPPCEGKFKHQERKNKNACQVVMLNKLMVIQAQEIHNAC